MGINNVEDKIDFNAHDDDDDIFCVLCNIKEALYYMIIHKLGWMYLTLSIIQHLLFCPERKKKCASMSARVQTTWCFACKMGMTWQKSEWFRHQLCWPEWLVNQYIPKYCLHCTIHSNTADIDVFTDKYWAFGGYTRKGKSIALNVHKTHGNSWCYCMIICGT